MKVKIGDLTKIKTGKLDANASSEDGQYPFFTCSREPLKISTYSYDCECVLVAGNGDLNVKYYNGKFDAYQRTYIIEDNGSGKLYMPYLYYFMEGYIEELRKQAIGGVIKYIKLGNLTEALIELPSVDEQKSIVEILEKAKGILDKRNDEICALDYLIKARFVEMFGNFVYERDRWNVSEIGDVADTIDPQPSHRTPPISPDGIPYVGIAECNYRTRRIDFKKARKVGQNVLREHTERYALDEGDFIIGKIGTIGKPFFIPAEQNYALSANTVLIKPIKGKVVPQYLYAVFQSEYMDRIIDAEKKSTSQPAFGIQKVRRIEIPIPPLELQKQFAAFVAQTDKSKVAVQKALGETQLLFDSLMHKYFG